MADGKPGVKWTPQMEEAYLRVLATVGGLEAAKPKAVHQLLVPDFPQLTIQNVKWHLLAHRRREERHREMEPAGIAPPTKWTGRLEEAYEAAVAAMGGLRAARPKALLDALQPEFPELTLQIVKWHLQGQRRREQRTAATASGPGDGSATASGDAAVSQPAGAGSGTTANGDDNSRQRLAAAPGQGGPVLATSGSVGSLARRAAQQQQPEVLAAAVAAAAGASDRALQGQQHMGSPGTAQPQPPMAAPSEQGLAGSGPPHSQSWQAPAAGFAGAADPGGGVVASALEHRLRMQQLREQAALAQEHQKQLQLLQQLKQQAAQHFLVSHPSWQVFLEPAALRRLAAARHIRQLCQEMVTVLQQRCGKLEHLLQAAQAADAASQARPSGGGISSGAGGAGELSPALLSSLGPSSPSVTSAAGGGGNLPWHAALAARLSAVGAAANAGAGGAAHAPPSHALPYALGATRQQRTIAAVAAAFPAVRGTAGGAVGGAVQAAGAGSEDGEVHLASCTIPNCRRCAYERRLLQRKQQLKARQQEGQPAQQQGPPPLPPPQAQGPQQAQQHGPPLASLSRPTGACDASTRLTESALQPAQEAVQSRQLAQPPLRHADARQPGQQQQGQQQAGREVRGQTDSPGTAARAISGPQALLLERQKLIDPGPPPRSPGSPTAQPPQPGGVEGAAPPPPPPALPAVQAGPLLGALEDVLRTMSWPPAGMQPGIASAGDEAMEP